MANSTALVGPFRFHLLTSTATPFGHFTATASFPLAVDNPEG